MKEKKGEKKKNGKFADVKKKLCLDWLGFIAYQPL